MVGGGGLSVGWGKQIKIILIMNTENFFFNVEHLLVNHGIKFWDYLTFYWCKKYFRFEDYKTQVISAN